MSGNSIGQSIKRRGGGYDRNVILEGIKAGKTNEQIAEDLGTDSLQSVRHARQRLLKSAKLPRETPERVEENDQTVTENLTEIKDYTPVWLDVPIFADQDTLAQFVHVVQDSNLSSQFEWFPETKGGELYI